MNRPATSSRPTRTRPELWRRAGTLFEQAVEVPPAERSAFLGRVCGADLALREAVEELLAFDAGDPEASAEGGAPVESGRDLGAYRLLRPIARGGMASVWLGERSGPEVEQQVAIKWIEGGAHPWIVPLFRRERQILARLEHPNIARFLDGGTTEEGLLYAVLEYVEGVPITRHCDARRLPLRERLSLFLKVCGAVQYAHQNLVVHRDLKPDNILVGDDGEPKLLDFGIAKPLHASRPAAATVTVERFLTPDYASPEQQAGEPVSMASDTFSLGVLLHQLLTGCLPRRLEGLPPSMPQGVAHELPSDLAQRGLSPEGEPAEARAAARAATPRRLRRQLRGDLDAIVLRCLQLDSRRRYPSVEALAEDLHRYLAGLPVQAQPPSLRYRCAKFVRRHRVAVAAGAALALGGIAFVVVTALYSQKVEAERDAAREAEAEAEAVQRFLLNAFRFADPYQGADVGAEGRRETTVREMLDRSTARIATDLWDRPLVQARLELSLGGVYLNLGEYGRALPLLRRSLELRRRRLGPDHPLVGQSLGLLGHALYTIGRPGEAEPLLRENLRLMRRHPETSPQNLAEALTNVGMLEDDLGHLPEAEAALKEAVAVYRRAYSTRTAEDRPLAITEIQLGGVLYQRKKPAEARGVLRDALRILRSRGLVEHPDTASALHYLAKVDQAEGRFDEGEALFRQALAMRVRLQGAGHPQALVARGALAKLLLARGSFPEAEALFREAAALDSKLYGPQSAEVAGDLELAAKARAGRAASQSSR